MKQIEKLSENSSYTAINLGNLEELMSYSLIHPVNKRLIDTIIKLELDVAN